jgi:fermentation-respiration switch protein FrsA (DUF1100 family)
MKKIIRNAAAIAAVGGVGVYTVYKLVFGKTKKTNDYDSEILKGKQYEPFQEAIRSGIEKAGKLSFQRIFIESRDGITLAGKYYHFKDQAPLILFFHGYRGTALRDGNGILLYAQKMGYNALLVDQRGHGKSGGKAITFGIKERYDCMDWIRYANRRFGEHTPIVLAGISMGASTVLMASDLGLPVNVKGIIADCPYSSPKGILRAVMKQIKFPVNVTYTAVRLGGKIFGRFDIEEHSVVESMKNCYVPVLFIHGGEDYFVPCEMSEECFEACGSLDKKRIVVDGAAHGMSFCVNGELYKKELDEFLGRILN